MDVRHRDAGDARSEKLKLDRFGIYDNLGRARCRRRLGRRNFLSLIKRVRLTLVKCFSRRIHSKKELLRRAAQQLHLPTLDRA